MAQPILQHRVQTDRTSELKARLDAAPMEHADAILALYELLQELKDNGVLDLLRGFAGSRADIITKVSEAANTPESITAMRNIISLIRIAGSIDPEILHDVAAIVAKQAPRRRSLWRAVRTAEAALYGVQVFGRVLIDRHRRAE